MVTLQQTQEKLDALEVTVGGLVRDLKAAHQKIMELEHRPVPASQEAVDKFHETVTKIQHIADRPPGVIPGQKVQPSLSAVPRKVE